jgi:hypothetical protein
VLARVRSANITALRTDVVFGTAGRPPGMCDAGRRAPAAARISGRPGYLL